jgi:hypothetical protein
MERSSNCLKKKPESNTAEIAWRTTPITLPGGCLTNGTVFFYAFNTETTFLTRVKSSPAIKTTELILNRISKVLMSFFIIIRIFEKGNTVLSFIFCLFFK